MQPSPRKLRSPLKWHGGKSYLARRIIELMPEHTTYIEPFAGGLSVLLNKPRVKREYSWDLNCELVTCWEGIQRHSGELGAILAATSYSELSFNAARASTGAGGDTAACAARFLIRNRMSRGGLGKDFAWSERLRGKRREGGPVPGELNSWDTFRESLPAIAERVANVKFGWLGATSMLREIADDDDTRDTLVYADPPYLHSTRTHRKAYACEMTHADHLELLAVLVRFPGMVLLSGYRSPLYDAALEGWSRCEFDLPNHSGQGATKQRRTECVWLNPIAVLKLDARTLAAH